MNCQTKMKLAGFVFVLAQSSWASDKSAYEVNNDIEELARSRLIQNWTSDPTKGDSSSVPNDMNWKLKFDTKNPSKDRQAYFAYEPDLNAPSESLWNKVWNGIGNFFASNSTTNTEPRDEIKRDIQDQKMYEDYLQGGTTGYVPELPLDMTNVKIMSEEQIQDQRDLWDDAISGPWQCNEYGRPYKFWGPKTTNNLTERDQ